MPKEPLAIAPRKLVWRDYEETPLEQGQIRVKSIFSAEKHGTSLAFYRGLEPTHFPMRVGNMTVGVVVEIGVGATRFKVGDRVYGYLPIRETHTIAEDRVEKAPPELSDEELVCIDPAVVALMAVREGHVRLGDKVAVFGLGAIGLMAVQMAKLSGALLVVGAEPLENRGKLAKDYGADMILNPKECDVGLELKKATGGEGVDIALEVSGSYQALNQAIKGTRYGGVIVPVSWYHGEARGLYLGGEWHFNRQIMISGARVESEPYREYPLWDRRRVYETIIDLFHRKKLTVKGMLSPIVEFKDIVEAYRLIDEEPGRGIKLGVKYA